MISGNLYKCLCSIAIAAILCSCGTTVQKNYPQGLVEYRSPEIEGYEDAPVLIDPEFLPVMDRISYYAAQNHLKLYVTSSFRKQNQVLTNVIVPPSSRSNHLVGHAIDINIVYNGTWYESKDMKKAAFDKLPPNIKTFFGQIKTIKGVRWGGDFNPEDPVHIDDGLNKDHPDDWDMKWRIYTQ